MLVALGLIFRVGELAILARVLYSWLDPDPYPSNEIKRLLWAVTDPILEPIRRMMPPLGMLDLSPVVALVVLQAMYSVLRSLLGG